MLIRRRNRNLRGGVLGDLPECIKREKMKYEIWHFMKYEIGGLFFGERSNRCDKKYYVCTLITTLVVAALAPPLLRFAEATAEQTLSNSTSMDTQRIDYRRDCNEVQYGR